MNTKFRPLVILACLATLLPPPSVRAEVFFYEGFEYANRSGPVPVDGFGDWTGPGFSTTPESLNHPLVHSIGGAIMADGGGTVSRNTGLRDNLTGVVWISFLMQFNQGVADWKEGRLIFSDLHKNQMISIGTRHAASNVFSVGAGGSYGYFNGATPKSFPVEIKGTEPQLVLLKYDFDAVTISFYVNPEVQAGEGEMRPVGSLTAADGLARIHMTLGQIVLRASKADGDFVQFDEIRIGRTLADALPATLSGK